MLSDSQNTSGKYFSADRLSLAITLCFFILITFLFADIPFFWDGAMYCRVAHYYYDTHFSSLILPPELDAYGSPMISWMYMAGAWILFGKTLLVSHLAVLPFLMGIAWEYYKLARKFLQPKMIPWVMLLLLCEPTFMTQSITMSYDISKIYFFLLGLNSLLNRNNFLYVLSITLLAFCSTRGLMMAAFLVPVHFFLQGGFKGKNWPSILKVYFIPTIIFISWICFHKIKTGWFLYSSHPEFAPDRKFADIVLMFRHGAFIIWQVLDYGRVFIWIFIVCGLFILKKRNFRSEKLKELFAMILILLVLFILVYFSYPIFLPFTFYRSFRGSR
jgi:hypothetical protein